MAHPRERFLSLERDIAQTDRAKAADDFEARLRYAQQEMEVMRLENEAALQQERAQALAQSSRLSGWLMASAMAILAVFFVLQRRTNQRLERTRRRVARANRAQRTYCACRRGWCSCMT